jgi:uncharacterized protein (TIGR02266 family)
VDIAARFREYVRLDRLQREGGLSPAELERWQTLRRFLSIHFAPDRPEAVHDARGSVRVPTRLEVSFASDQELHRCLMTSLSRGGVFVQTEDPLELGSCFTLTIHVEDPRLEISVDVEVASVGVGPDLARNKQGMGLRFLEMSPETEKQLRELYERSVPG